MPVELSPQFLFVVCQIGAEPACKQELGKQHPELRFAYSRPGFLTFKIPNQTFAGDEQTTTADGPLAPTSNSLSLPPATQRTDWSDHPTLISTFARTFGMGLGRIRAADLNTALAEIQPLIGERPIDQLHVWQRDEMLPGERGFEPFVSVLAETIGEQIAQLLNQNRPHPLELNRIAGVGQRVLDVILISPDEWYVGWHTADSIPQRWPGGVPPLELPESMISRAYLKLAEALEWSRLNIGAGDICLEIGSAPGGAAQLLLEKKANVIAVDPADLDPSLQNQPGLKHLKMRGKNLRKSQLSEVRWLLVDVNVAPNYTLDTAEEIVKHARTQIRGLILTLKLTDWALAEHIDGYRQRVRQWGFKVVRTRQLAFNRHEFCLVALRHRYDARRSTRPPGKESSGKDPSRKGSRRKDSGRNVPHGETPAGSNEVARLPTPDLEERAENPNRLDGELGTN